MNQYSKSIFGVLAVCAGLATLAGDANARSAGSDIARSEDPNSAACFPSAGGALQNICGSTVPLDFPLTIDSTGSKTVTTTVSMPTLQNTDFSCTSYSENQTMTSFSASNVTHTSNGAGSTFLMTSGGRDYYKLSMSISVPTNGYMLMICWVPTQGGVHNTIWTS